MCLMFLSTKRQGDGGRVGGWSGVEGWVRCLSGWRQTAGSVPALLPALLHTLLLFTRFSPFLPRASISSLCSVLHLVFIINKHTELQGFLQHKGNFPAQRPLASSISRLVCLKSSVTGSSSGGPGSKRAAARCHVESFHYSGSGN